VSVNEPTRKIGTRQKILVGANFVAVGLLIMIGYYKAPPRPIVTSTCQTVREVEYCHWSDGGYSMTMPDGAVYTREHANDPWERDWSGDSPRDETTLSKAKHKS
jgi:hypothetical protein